MSKRLIIVLALALVAGLTVAAYAEVQNVKVSGDLLTQGVARNDFNLNGTADHDRAILGFVRVRVDADLTDNVGATVRLLNEREWASDTSAGAADSNIDIDLAYATLKEFLTVPLINAPLTFVVGRQELRYGNALIIGNAGSLTTNLPNSMRDLSIDKAFDAVKAVLNYDPLVVDFVYAKVEENTSTRQDDVNLAGINASYAVNKDLSTEMYFWSRTRNFGSTGMPTGVTLDETLNTLGTRGMYTGIENLMLGLEGAWQFGDHVPTATLYPDDIATSRQKVNAYAVQLLSTYGFPGIKFTPTVSLNYTRLSGAKDLNNGDNYKGFTAIFEDQGYGTIMNRVIGFSNCNIINLGGTMKPMDDVTVKLDWNRLSLVQPFSDTGNGDGSVSRHLTGVATDAETWVKSGKRHLADEIDLTVTYDYTEDVQLGLSGGIYIPGPVYDKVNSENASQIIGSMKVTF